MKLYEFCQLANIGFELSCNDYGYVARLIDGDLICKDLEQYADRMDGGTQFCWSRGSDPNEAMSNLCKWVQGRLIRIGDKRPYRHVRAPQELTL